MPILALALSLLLQPLFSGLGFGLLKAAGLPFQLWVPIAIGLGFCFSLAMLYLLPWVRHRHFPRWTLLAMLLPCALILLYPLAHYLEPLQPDFHSMEGFISGDRSWSVRMWLSVARLPALWTLTVLVAVHFLLARPAIPQRQVEHRQP